jgi:hypothetical protein
MKRLLLLLAVSACAHPGLATRPGRPLRSVPFVACDSDSACLLRASPSGRIDVYDDRLIVTLFPDTLVHGVSADSIKADAVRVGLASGDVNGAWRIDHESKAVPIAAIEGPPRLAADSVRFVISNVPLSDLQARWLVFRFSAVVMSQLSNQRLQADNFLHVPTGPLRP